MRMTTSSPTDVDDSVADPAMNSDTDSAPRQRDQPFLKVLQEVAARTGYRWVELNSGRQHGKPTVAGTRIPVSVVLTYIAAGHSLEQITEAFPEISADQLRGAVDYAAEVLDQDVGA